MIFRSALLIILTVTATSAASAQTIDAALIQIQSGDLNTRMEGFYTISQMASATQLSSDPVRSGLVNLLILENSTFRTPSEPPGPAFADYFSEVFTLVSCIGDTRTIPVLLDNIDTGRIATDALASFGPAALDGVIITLGSTDPPIRNGAVHTLQTIVDTGTAADAASVSKIRSALEAASLDAYPNVRRNAIVGLAKLLGVTISVAPMLVNVDIKPGGYPNAINPRDNGVIPVAILSTPIFDATRIDSTTVRFGPGQAPPRSGAHVEDVNGDGLPDIVLQFSTPSSQIACGDTASFLIGKTTSGQMVVGADSVLTVGCK
jgi:hypothetical protein